MDISEERMEQISLLSKLYIPQQEREKTKKELGKILNYMELIQELDVSQMGEVAEETTLKNVLREDKRKPSAPRNHILQNAKNQKDGCFQVPKTVE